MKPKAGCQPALRVNLFFAPLRLLRKKFSAQQISSQTKMRIAPSLREVHAQCVKLTRFRRIPPRKTTGFGENSPWHRCC